MKILGGKREEYAAMVCRDTGKINIRAVGVIVIVLTWYDINLFV